MIGEVLNETESLEEAQKTLSANFDPIAYGAGNCNLKFFLVSLLRFFLVYKYLKCTKLVEFVFLYFECCKILNTVDS